jgi:hypothetical protein
MKVPGSEVKDGVLARVQEKLAEKAAAKSAADKKDAATNSAPSLMGAIDEDSMQVSALGDLLRSELNPVKMADERRAKIDALKEKIKNGTYNPPLEGVAAAVGEEISLEVLLSGGALQKAE